MPGVVGDAAGGGPAQLVEDRRAGRREPRRPDARAGSASSARIVQVGADARRRRRAARGGAAPGPPGWSSCRPPRPTARSGSTTSASAAVSRQHEVGDHQQVQARSRRLDPGRAGARRPPGWSRRPAAPAARPGCRARRAARRPTRPGPGSVGRVDAPHPGDVRAGRRVVDLPVAGQLVGLLPVLAAALAVALAGEAAVPGAGAAGQAEGEGQVDERGDRVDALGVLLGAARGEDDRAGRAVPSARAVASRSATGTPVSRSTRAGHQPATPRRTASKPVVRVGDVVPVDAAPR